MRIKKYDNWRFLVTSSCNSKCFFCHRDGTGIDNFFLNFQFFENIIRKYKKHISKVRFSGGEPLLHSDIFKMIKTTLFLTQDVSIVTNGLLLSKYIKQIKDSKLPKITVSLHSLNSDTFERIAGIKHKQYSKIINSIKKLKEFVKIKLNVVILKNLNTETDELEKLINFVIENNLNIEFIELDLGSIQDFNLEKYHYTPNRLVNDIKKIFKISFKFDSLESNWISIIKNSKIEIHKALCFNKLCKKCVYTRPILVYPNGKINRCRLGKPLIRNVDITL